VFAYNYLVRFPELLPSCAVRLEGVPLCKSSGTYQSYSAVSTKSSIFELTNSKIRFSAVFLLPRNSSVASRMIGPPAEVDDRAAIRSCSSSRHAVSKCSRLMRIWTICPRYCELSLSTRDLQTLSESSWSNDYSILVKFAGYSLNMSIPF
jgi:hypothetical protein